MARASLYQPYRRLLRECNWLLVAFNESLSDLSGQRLNRNVSMLSAEMAVVRLHDAWARFCRELIVTSAADKPLTANGVRLPRAPGLLSRSDVIPRLLTSYRRQRQYEPKWAHANECIDAAKRLRIPNYLTIAAAIGATNSPAEEMRLLRNYFVHRSEDTALKIRNVSMFSTVVRLNLENLVGTIVAPGTTRIEFWVLQLNSVAEAAIQ